MSATEIVFCGNDAALGVFGPLVIAVTDGPESFRPEYVQRVLNEVSRLRRTTHANKLVYLYVAGERSTLPGADVRETAAKVADLFDACIGVHEGTGFRASALRAVIVGFTMLSRARVRPEIVATVDAAAAYAGARHPELGGANAVLDAIREVRAAAAGSR